jgi:bacterioferritin-associated ferredoxin
MIVCVCNRITEKEVGRAARAGARTTEKAYERLGCDVLCGCCVDYAQEVIDQELSGRPLFRVVASHAA